MARRRKSVNDIANQENRLTRALGNNENNPRLQRVQRIANRYYANIERSRTWQRTWENAYENRLATTPRYLREENQRAEARTAGYGAADRVRVSQRIYMGLNNG